MNCQCTLTTKITHQNIMSTKKECLKTVELISQIFIPKDVSFLHAIVCDCLTMDYHKHRI